MSLLVVGSIAFDSVTTPHGTMNDVLGGSASYFSYAASFFTDVRLVGVVGQDFPDKHRELLASRGIDTAGLTAMDGKTFRWEGRYEGDMAVAETVNVELNVFGDFEPMIPGQFRDSEYVFLANGSPVLQRRVLEQVAKPALAVCDTMNLWIEQQRDELLELLQLVDGMVINDAEARQLTGEANLIRAGNEILGLGPRFVVIKKGEHGALLISDGKPFALPAYPTADVVDPTGAGDSFAGGVMGSLAKSGDLRLGALKKALAYGTAVASINIEDFSLESFKRSSWEDIQARYDELVEMMSF